jgi:hypothetical protein
MLQDTENALGNVDHLAGGDEGGQKRGRARDGIAVRNYTETLTRHSGQLDPRVNYRI